VLDNCEHVIDACAVLVHQLLQASAGLRILASSRERFNIAERRASGAAAGGADARRPGLGRCPAASEAVRLFVERARGIQPAFALNDRNTPAVVEICRRLDGIRWRSSSRSAPARTAVEAIAARVNDRFRLLASGDRTALPRQKTLRALIDWSHDLLAEPERTLFRRSPCSRADSRSTPAEAVAAGARSRQVTSSSS